MDGHPVVDRIVKKLTAAEGYLELQLPELALEELERVESPGPFTVPFMWITGQALQAQGRFDEAIAPLRHAAQSLPDPMKQDACAALSDCLTRSGRQVSAQNLEATMNPAAAEESTNSGPTLRLDISNLGSLEFNLKLGEGLTISIQSHDE